MATFDLRAHGVKIVAADGDTSGRGGHFHVFVDRPVPAPGAAIPKEPGIVHTTDSRVTLEGLAIGSHRISVVLGDGAHRRIGDAVLERSFTVEGPSVTIAAPATVASGAPVPLEIKVEGLKLVARSDERAARRRHALRSDIGLGKRALGSRSPAEAACSSDRHLFAPNPTANAPGEERGERFGAGCLRSHGKETLHVHGWWKG